MARCIFYPGHLSVVPEAPRSHLCSFCLVPARWAGVTVYSILKLISLRFNDSGDWEKAIEETLSKNITIKGIKWLG
jgi:hypothetical protein